MDNKQKLTPGEIAVKLLNPEAYEEEQKKKKEAIQKEAAAKSKKIDDQPKPKFYFDVKVECMLPATLTYRILAEDAHQALTLVKGKAPNSVQHKLVGRKELVARVYEAGSNMMKFMKRLLET